MLSCRLMELKFQKRLLMPMVVLAHSKTCPTRKAPVCPGSKGSNVSKSGSGGPFKIPDFKRALKSAPVRFGFIPDNWFLFFHPITGVSGPYLFGFLLTNYCLSKEIFVMEHEYYLGLSIATVVYYVTTRFGPTIGKILDAEVDAIQQEYEKGRQDQKDSFTAMINGVKDAQMRAQGQKILIDAKKENIAMQYEAIYRERMMHVYRTTRGRMDYHVKRYSVEGRIHQKWMVDWILNNVRKAITPEFEKQALDAAIRDLSAAAAKVK